MSGGFRRPPPPRTSGSREPAEEPRSAAAAPADPEHGPPLEAPDRRRDAGGPAPPSPGSGHSEEKPRAGPADAAEHLNAAISELEDVLSEHHGVAPGPLSAGPDRGGQYTIPLLDEVVMPGAPPPGASEDEEAEGEPLFDHAAELRAFADGAGAYRPILDRLASEIEVIVQAGVDDALKDAARAIRRRVNEHLEIVLPEILDELARKDRRG